MGMAASLAFQCFQGRDRDLWSKLASKASPISELWVQLRDPVSKNKVENNQRKLQISLRPLHAQANTFTQLCTHTQCLSKHTHTLNAHFLKSQILGGCVFLEGLFNCNILPVLQWVCCSRERATENHSPKHSYWIRMSAVVHNRSAFIWQIVIEQSLRAALI